jgi:hypothetical protein
MLTEIGQSLAAATRHPATYTLIFDDYGQPIILVYQFAGSIVLSKAGDPNFADTLRDFGLSSPKVQKFDTDAFVRP